MAQGRISRTTRARGARALLATLVRDAKASAAERCPTPRLVECNREGHRRDFDAKLNPSATHNSYSSGGEIILHGRHYMNVFLEHLAKLAVTS